MDIRWNDNNTITVKPTKRPKKVTGTRLGAIFGQNKWSSQFNAWCAITRTYEEPFEDTIYTIAGKTIEPKQAQYMADKYFWKTLVRPEDVFGKDPFKKTYGDFFRDVPIFGGMWDYLFADEFGKPKTVLEMKTTKRVEDWADDIPEYYALQAALYAHLLGVDEVIMVCTVLGDADYDHPEDFTVTAENTFERAFSVSERYPKFDLMLKAVEKWWNDHVLTGISPEYDEKVDADILKELRKNSVNPDTDIEALVAEAESLKEEIDKAKASYADAEKRFKSITEQLKKKAVGEFRDGDKTVEIHGKAYTWVTSRTVSSVIEVDTEKMAEDGILDKYAKTVVKETYRFAPMKKESK